MSIPDGHESGSSCSRSNGGRGEKLIDPNVTHPRQAKEVLGKDIVTFYYGNLLRRCCPGMAETLFQARSHRHDMVHSSVRATDGKIWICKLLVLAGLAKSPTKPARQCRAAA